MNNQDSDSQFLPDSQVNGAKSVDPVKNQILNRIFPKSTSSPPKIILKKPELPRYSNPDSPTSSAPMLQYKQPDGGPNVGDVVQFWSQDKTAWVKCKITKKHTQPASWKDYYNFIFESGESNGIYLRPNKPYWTVLENTQWGQHI